MLETLAGAGKRRSTHLGILLVLIGFLLPQQSLSKLPGKYKNRYYSKMMFFQPGKKIRLNVQICGNGALEGDELCDDGNTVNGDGCSCSCFMEPADATHCGNGICEVGEFHSGGFPSDRPFYQGSCPEDCAFSVVVDSFYFPTCGNCVRDTVVYDAGAFTEECDDGNRRDSDGCDSSCRLEPEDPTVCGNGTVEGGEECDDGNLIDDDTCRNDCTIPPGDRELCEVPDGSDLPPGVRFRDYPDSRHISYCETESSVRYIICGNDGTITVNINDCEEGVACSEGACMEDLFVDPICEDSDVTDEFPDGQNPEIRGTVSGREIDGDEYSHTDTCSVDGARVYERFCRPDETPAGVFIPCEPGEICREGVCVPGEFVEPTCEDSDTTDEFPDGRNPDTRGTVSGREADGDIYSYTDSCNTDGSRVYERICRTDGTPGGEYMDCDAGEICRDGACVPGEFVEPTCEDSDVTDAFPDGQNPGRQGTVSGRQADGDEYSNVDSCLSDGSRVYERFCREDGTAGGISIVCGDGQICRDGACVACACSRTEATAAEAGHVTGIDCVIQHDICRTRTDGSHEVVRYACGAEGLPAESVSVFCADGCSDGRCL